MIASKQKEVSLRACAWKKLKATTRALQTHFKYSVLRLACSLLKISKLKNKNKTLSKS